MPVQEQIGLVPNLPVLDDAPLAAVAPDGGEDVGPPVVDPGGERRIRPIQLSPGRIVVKLAEDADPGVVEAVDRPIVVVEAAAIAAPKVRAAFARLQPIPEDLLACPLHAGLFHQGDRGVLLVVGHAIPQGRDDAEWRRRRAGRA